jgi:hypothetical protein
MNPTYSIWIEGMGIVCLGALVVFLGIAITRVGLYGEYLGRFKLVSHVQKYAERPRRHHRYITAGMGVVFVLLGIVLLIFHFVLLHLR